MLRPSILAFLSAASALRITDLSGANPMRRVITILQDTQKELEEEARKEEDLFDNFECYCKKNTEAMQAQGAAATQKAEELTGRGEAEKSEKEQLDQDLVQHKADREQAKKDLAEATAIREKEHQAFVEENAEFLANLKSLDGAIAALEKGMGRAFLQAGSGSRLQAVISTLSNSDSLTLHQKKVVSAFLSRSPYGAYQASGGEIVGILKQMQERMDKDHGGVVAREEAAAAAFKELKAAKLQEIQALTDAIESKQVRSGELAVAYTTTMNELKDTQEALADNEKFLAELGTSCEDKKADYEERVKTRADEIRAISEAIAVLNDDDALDLFKGTLAKPEEPSLLQTSYRSDIVRRTQSLLQHLSKTSSRSSQLNLLSTLLKGASKADFSKVIAMIDEMIDILGKEQTDDDNQRDWCREEFDKNEDETKASERKLEKLTSFIEESEARLEELTQEIATANDEIKALDKAVAEATEQRKKENAEFVQTQTELTAAQQLIEKAINRLNRFYNPAQYKEPEKRQLTEEERIAKNLGQDIDETSQKKIAGTDITVEYMQKPKAASLVQIRSHSQGSQPAPPPETWGAYEKKDQKSGGVIALLNKLKGELKSDQEQGQHEEKTAVRDYEKLMADSRSSRDALSESVTTNTAAKAELQELVDEAKANKQTETEAHMELKKYLSELHGSCDFLIQHFDLRKEARTNEIEGLKNAKAVLNGASYGAEAPAAEF